MGVRRFSAQYLCEGAATAALYAALTAALAPLSFGAGGTFQLRVAEALTLLPVLSPAAVPGLFVGCLLGNLVCGAPLPDVIVGSLATLLAAGLTRKFRGHLLRAALAPVVCNTLLVGAMLALVYGLPLGYAFLTVAPGEAAACCLLGIPLVRYLCKTGLFKTSCGPQQK